MGSLGRAVLVATHLQALHTMAPCGKIVLLFLLAEATMGSRRLRNNVNRQGKNLLGTFPFNQQNGANEHHEHHGDHGDHHGDHGNKHPISDLESRANRQAEDGAPSFGEVAEAGKKCIDKVEMVEETEYDDVVQCDHSYDRRCHTTYVTNYESQQEEDCDENFRKSCFIEYESECWTKQEVHDVQDDVVECETVVEEKCEDNTSGYTTTTDCSKWPKEVCNVSKKQVKKYTPITACTKEPRELCAPAGCGFKEGSEECFEKVQTVVQDAPKEQCTLEPPEECVDVPKEVCTRSRTNPRKVKKPVVKKC